MGKHTLSKRLFQTTVLVCPMKSEMSIPVGVMGVIESGGREVKTGVCSMSARATGGGQTSLLMSPGSGCARPSSFTSLRRPPAARGETRLRLEADKKEDASGIHAGPGS
jgi:hypothetical protein